MKSFLLAAFLIWPLHHKKHVEPAPAEEPKPMFDPLDSGVPNNPCEYFQGLYMYEGSDSVFGISSDSCKAAFKDWRHNPGSVSVNWRI